MIDDPTLADYARRGFVVMPLKAGQKVAYDMGWNAPDYEANPKVWETWDGQRNRLNVGILTRRSGIFVLDVDTAREGHPLDGVASLERLTAEYGPLPDTYTVRTRAGGLHYYFKDVPGLRKDNRGRVGPGIDVQADRAYVVAAPSWVDADEKGPAGAYTVEKDLEVAEAPAWLVALAMREPERRPEAAQRVAVGADGGEFPDAYVAAVVARECASIVDAVDGQQNDTINRAAFSLGTLVAAGALDHTEAYEVLLAASLRGNHPRARAVPSIESGLSAGMLKPRVAPDPREGAVVEPEGSPETFEEFWDERHELSVIRDFARARMTSPWAVLGVVLGRVTACAAPDYHLPPIVGGKGSLNMFFAFTGPSGAGKGAAISAGREVLDVQSLLVETKEENVGSGEGLLQTYVTREKNAAGQWESVQHTTRAILTVDEVDTLAALTGRSGSTLMPVLRSAWSGERLGFGYAAQDKRLTIQAHAYRMVMFVGVQPERSGALLDDSDGGTPQRFVWLPVTDPGVLRNPPPAPDPLVWKPPVEALGKHYTVRVCATAEETIREARYQRMTGNGDALDGHALYCREKVAVAFALLNGRADMSEDDWRLSGVVMEVSDATRAAARAALSREASKANVAKGRAEAERAVVVSEVVEDTSVKRVGKGIVKRLTAAGPDGMSRVEAKRKTAHRDRGYFDEAVDHLAAAGQVVLEAVDANGEPGQRLRLAAP